MLSNYRVEKVIEATVRVVVHSDDDFCLSFDLIFDTGHYKPITLDAYAIRAFRGLSARDIIEASAKDYFDSLGEPVDVVKIIFI